MKEREMDEEPACGKGLAEHSALPATLGELATAMAQILEVHQTALDVTDEPARQEYRAYVKLALVYRDIAAQRRATAGHMAAYRDLPMGRHDERAMASPEAFDVFASFVRVEQELLTLLRKSVERDERMLAEMRGAVG
jgi:hypothetical protein